LTPNPTKRKIDARARRNMLAR